MSDIYQIQVEVTAGTEYPIDVTVDNASGSLVEVSTTEDTGDTVSVDVVDGTPNISDVTVSEPTQQVVNVGLVSPFADHGEHVAYTTWTEPTFMNGWTQYGGEWNPLEYRKVNDDTVEFRGLTKAGSTTSGTVLFVLPVGFRPPNTLIGITMFDGSPDIIGRVDIRANGEVAINGSTGTPGLWISFTGVSFSTLPVGA